MTRINCIPVTYLTDEHLKAEYREITRISKLARLVDGADTYKMGAGHVKFFYDKGLYLADRTQQLYQECLERGFNVTYKAYKIHDSSDLNNWWTPTPKDIICNLERLQEKVKEKPAVYRYMGERLVDIFDDPNIFYRQERELTCL